MRSLGIDIGAESGRAITGTIAGSRLVTKEVHRFPNRPIREDGTLRWNLPELVNQVEFSLRSAAEVHSVGVVTWGVDYVLLASSGTPLELPYHYRDSRTNGVLANVLLTIPMEEIYAVTGTQFLPFNTLFQLLASKNLAEADCFQTIPDYLLRQLNHGQTVGCEYTNAMTTQCLNARTQDWDETLLGRFGIPRKIFPPIVPSGTVLGERGGVKIIAPACHDTASAAIAAQPGSAWLSSGTWSILGINTDAPILTPEALAANFTNEGSACGRYRLCKNVMGLWLLQRLRSELELEQASYDDLVQMACRTEPTAGYFDVDAPSLLAPENMQQAVAQELNAWDQALPQSPGAWVRVIFESLALKYRFVLCGLESVSGMKISTINIIGGGSQNDLLNQLTADICQRPVIAGPIEATALGNLMMQFTTMGAFKNLQEAQTCVRESSSCRVFEPANASMWDDHYASYLRHLQSSC